jgi:hypothetical protein
MRKRLIEKDLLNRKYFHLLIKQLIKRNDHGQLIVKVICDCGKEKELLFNNIKSGLVKSCGCTGNNRHRRSKTVEYKTWANILQKCHNKNHNVFKHYGGRGIKVCNEWKNSFEKFYEDMGSRPEGCSLDRIDPNGDYSVCNCRWADAFIQNVNKNVVIDVLKAKYEKIYKVLKDQNIIK